MNRVDHRNALSFCRSMICLAMLGFWPALDQARAEAPNQDNLAGQYRATQWKSENGLPQNTVRCLLQARDGYLWIGTQAGLARFDGLRFTVFNKANTPEMASDNCVTLAEGLKGDLWLGTENGLLLWSQHRFQAIDLGFTNAQQSYIRNLSLGRNGVLWVGTYDGL